MKLAAWYHAANFFIYAKACFSSSAKLITEALIFCCVFCEG